MINALKVPGKAFLATLLICPQLSEANGFTSADVLEWEESAQNSMFQTSIGMMAIVATQLEERGELAECIDQWYFSSAAVTETRNNEIRAVLESYSDYHPQAMIMAVVEKACGKL